MHGGELLKEVIDQTNARYCTLKLSLIPMDLYLPLPIRALYFAYTNGFCFHFESIRSLPCYFKEFQPEDKCRGHQASPRMGYKIPLVVFPLFLPFFLSSRSLQVSTRPQK